MTTRPSPHTSATRPADRPTVHRAAGWAAVDQCLFGFSNLILNLLLARWLSADAYGAFTMGQVGVFLAGVVHAAVLVEPMLVLAARRRGEFVPYLRLLLLGHGAFAMLAATALFGLSLAVAPRFGSALVAGAIATPFVLGLWLLRRACYVKESPRMAALGSGFYLLGALAAIAGLSTASRLGPEGALFAMGAVSGMACVGLLVALRIPLFGRVDRSLLAQRLPEHARIARSLLFMVPFEWLPAHFYYLVLPWVGGAAAPALFKASMNLVQPLIQVHSALRMGLVPRFVRAQHGDGEAVRGLAGVGWVLVGTALVAYALLFTFGGSLAGTLYANRYPEAGSLLRYLGLIPVFTAICAVTRSQLRARMRLRDEFYAYGAASAIAIVIGLPAVLGYGVIGAAATFVVAYAVLAGLQLWAVRKAQERDRAAAFEAATQGSAG